MQKLKIPDSIIIQKLTKSYGFGPTKLTRLKGFYDANYKVETNAGNFFLKIYGKDKIPSVKFQVEFMRLLKNKNLSVAETVIQKNGQQIFTIAKKPAILQKWINGEHLRDLGVSSKRAFVIGEEMAKMHKLSNNFKIKGQQTKKYFWDLAQFDMVVNSFPKAKSIIKKEWKPYVEEVIAEYFNHKQNLKHLKAGYIHNDFHDNNILMSGNKIAGVVDFGDSLKSWFMADLSIPMEHIFLPEKNHSQLVKSFIRGYKSIFNLPEFDWNYLPLLIKMRAVMLIIGIPLELGENTEEMYKRFFNNTFKSLKYLSNEKNLQKFNKLIKQ